MTFETLAGARCPVVGTVGNHDAWQNSDDVTTHDIFKSHVQNTIVNYPQFKHLDNETANGYIDDPSVKIRFIVLDGEGRAGWVSNSYDDIRANLTTMLNSMPRGYRSVIICHKALNSSLGDEFSDTIEAQSILEAYANKIICCISGHAHRDASATVNGVLYIQTTCAGVESVKDGYTRNVGSANETAFDVFVIDQTNSTIHAVRYGAGASRVFTIPEYEPEPDYGDDEPSEGSGSGNGKSAYDYAVEGGYMGSEEEFAFKLAEDNPSDDEFAELTERVEGLEKLGVGKSAFEYAEEGGYEGTEEEFGVKLAQENPTIGEFNALSNTVNKLNQIAVFVEEYLPEETEDSEWENGEGCYLINTLLPIVVGETYIVSIDGVKHTMQAISVDPEDTYLGGDVLMENEHFRVEYSSTGVLDYGYPCAIFINGIEPDDITNMFECPELSIGIYTEKKGTQPINLVAKFDDGSTATYVLYGEVI